MSDCSKHRKDIAGISNMKALAEMIGDLHYEVLPNLFFHLAKKLEADARKDNDEGREKLASALQYTGFSILESAYRMEKVWLISKPYMRSEDTPAAAPGLESVKEEVRRRINGYEIENEQNYNALAEYVSDSAKSDCQNCIDAIHDRINELQSLLTWLEGKCNQSNP